MAPSESILEQISAVMRVDQYFPPADPSDVERVGRELGVQFPDWLRRIYLASDGFIGPTGVRYLYRLRERNGVLDFTTFLRQEWADARWLKHAIVFGDNGLGGSSTIQWATLNGQLIEWCYGDGPEYQLLDVDVFGLWEREQRTWVDLDASS
jgi:hypothetical protein